MICLHDLVKLSRLQFLLPWNLYRYNGQYFMHVYVVTHSCLLYFHTFPHSIV